MKPEWRRDWPELVALVPRPGGTQVHLRGSAFYDERSVEAVAKTLAGIFAKDLALVRREARRVVGHERYLPLALHPVLVLLPLRVVVEGGRGARLGYVNLPAYEGCQEAEKEDLRLVALQDGLRLRSPWSAARIRKVVGDAASLQRSCRDLIIPNARVRRLLLGEDWPAGGPGGEGG